MRKCAEMIRWASDRSLHLNRKSFPVTKRKIFNIIRFGGGQASPGGKKSGDYQKTVLQTAMGGKEGMRTSSDGQV